MQPVPGTDSRATSAPLASGTSHLAGTEDKPAGFSPERSAPAMVSLGLHKPSPTEAEYPLNGYLFLLSYRQMQCNSMYHYCVSSLAVRVGRGAERKRA